MATKPNRYSNYEIWLELDSDAESGSQKATETVQISPLAKTRLQRKTTRNEESRRASTESNLRANKTPNNSCKEPLMSKSEKVSFKIKLRRSTEQSMYKIQNANQDTPAKKSTPKRTRSNSSDSSSISNSDSRTGNYSKGEIEPIQETSEKENSIGSSQRGARSRRPPLKLASYEYSPLPSSNYSESSPKLSIRLRKRQPINYNESNFQLNNDVFNRTPSKVKEEDGLLRRSKDRGIGLASDKGITDTAIISRTNLRKRNLTNIQLSEKELDSDTDSSSVSSTTRRRTRLSSLKTLGVYPETANDNKENMPSTSKRMDVTPSRLTGPRKISSRKIEDTSIPIVDLALSKTPRTNKSIASTQLGTKIIISDTSEYDSDASTVSRDSYKQMRAEYEMRADPIPPTVLHSARKAKNAPLKTAKKPTTGPDNRKKGHTRKRAASARANKNMKKMEMETINLDSSCSDVANDEELPQNKVKRALKSADKKEEVATPVAASQEQAAEEQSITKDSIPKTPKSLTALRYKSFTPSIGNRYSAALKPVTPLQNARARLHVGAVPKSLPCREEEFNTIFSYLKGKLLDKTGGCIYICGVPGTGKTATVNEVIRCLQKLAREGELEDFNFVAINALKLTEPRQAYVHILKQLTGETYIWPQAQKLLENRFKKRSLKTTLLLVDEFDHICAGNQHVVYNILDWPTGRAANLVVITIANRMDLPEKMLMSRVASRMGYTRLTFQPYNHHQLLEIVVARLKGFDSFRSEAIQLVARKVSAVSGDARRALDICRRAVEITESRNSGTISLEDVTQAISEMIASPKIRAIQCCSELEKLFLLAVTAEVERTSVEEVVFQDAYIQMQSLCSFEGVTRINVTEALGICDRLAASRILICKHFRVDVLQKILLNVSTDDIYYAIKQSQD